MTKEGLVPHVNHPEGKKPWTLGTGCSGSAPGPRLLAWVLLPARPLPRKAPSQSHRKAGVNESLTVYFRLKVFHISEHSYVTVVLTIRKSNSAKGRAGMSRLFFFFFSFSIFFFVSASSCTRVL